MKNLYYYKYDKDINYKIKHMNTLNILLQMKYICYLKNVTWYDIYVGICSNYFDNKAVICYAQKLIENENINNYELVFEIAISNDIDYIFEYIEKLADDEVNKDFESAQNKILVIVLQYLLENNSNIKFLRDNIDTIYADFDYNKDISQFVSYTPNINNNNYENIQENLKKYVDNSPYIKK